MDPLEHGSLHGYSNWHRCSGVLPQLKPTLARCLQAALYAATWWHPPLGMLPTCYPLQALAQRAPCTIVGVSDGQSQCQPPYLGTCTQAHTYRDCCRGIRPSSHTARTTCGEQPPWVIICVCHNTAWKSMDVVGMHDVCRTQQAGEQCTMAQSVKRTDL